jgi:hypothetical protein
LLRIELEAADDDDDDDVTAGEVVHAEKEVGLRRVCWQQAEGWFGGRGVIGVGFGAGRRV